MKFKKTQIQDYYGQDFKTHDRYMGMVSDIKTQESILKLSKDLATFSCCSVKDAAAMLNKALGQEITSLKNIGVYLFGWDMFSKQLDKQLNQMWLFR